MSSRQWLCSYLLASVLVYLGKKRLLIRGFYKKALVQKCPPAKRPLMQKDPDGHRASAWLDTDSSKYGSYTVDRKKRGALDNGKGAIAYLKMVAGEQSTREL